jgi:hypothetical protein
LGDEATGLAAMLSDLIRQNLEEKPDKRSDLEKLDIVVSIEVSDADVSVRLSFRGGTVALRNAEAGAADIRISATAETVLSLCSLRIRRGIPMLVNRDGLAMLGKILSGKLRIGGLLLHPVQLLRFTRLMSVNDERPAVGSG